MKKLKAVVPQRTNIDQALELLRSNNQKVIELINLMNIYEKRKLRTKASIEGIKNELLKHAYRE